MENYNHQTKTCELTISDMTCSSCVAHIQGDLMKQAGIEEAAVNFATEKATIKYDPKAISPEKIIEVIKQTGYSAQLINDENKNHDHHNHRYPENTNVQEDHSHHAQAEGQNQTTKRRNNFIIAAILSAVVLILMFGFEFNSKPMAMAGISFIILAFTGREFYQKGLPALFRGRPGMDSLVAVSVGAAFLYSTYNVAFANPKDEYFMDVAVITTFILLGRYLEALAKGRASEAIKKLLTLSAKVAHRITNGEETEDVPVDEIQKGDLLFVKPGEKVPVDGIIIKGEATIDESMVTGESIPVDKALGSNTIGATINGNTAFTMRAEKVGKETMLAHIVKLVEEAQMSKAPIQKLVDWIAGYFVWGVLVIGIITFLGWTWLTGDTSQAFIATVAVLVIACPCALGLATPISIVVGSGKGASMGILLKKAESLEKMHKVTAICFDKTGTITKGHPSVHEFKAIKEEQKSLAIANALEKSSEHPLAKSIVDYIAKKSDISSLKIDNFHAITGKGVKGTIDGEEYFLGSLRYITELNIEISAHQPDIDQLQKDGNTVLILANKAEIMAYFGVKDQIKETSKKAIQLLKSHNIRPVMLTGDNQQVAEAMAKEVGIEEVHAEVSPSDKTEIVKELQKAGEVVAMVGDGINDSPALSQADVGLAMGTGTDIAMESGDMVLVKGDLLKAVEAIELSTATYRNIKQNLFWAFIYNSVGIPIAAFGLLNPMLSSVAMAFSSISVVLNALRLKRFKVMER